MYPVDRHAIEARGWRNCAKLLNLILMKLGNRIDRVTRLLLGVGIGEVSPSAAFAGETNQSRTLTIHLPSIFLLKLYVFE
jgi:hypothetical protein